MMFGILYSSLCLPTAPQPLHFTQYLCIVVEDFWLPLNPNPLMCLSSTCLLDLKIGRDTVLMPRIFVRINWNNICSVSILLPLAFLSNSIFLSVNFPYAWNALLVPPCLLRKTFLDLLRLDQVPLADTLVPILVAIPSPLPNNETLLLFVLRASR